MESSQKTIIAIVIVAIVGFGVYFFAQNSGPGKLDNFAMCLKDKGATFYGAFWCPHCQATKKMFGTSAKLLPYVECSTPDGQGQLQICKDKGITGYPTWKFATGTDINGETTLQKLSDATGCPLPANN